jgi:hypothetical protein
MSSPLVRLYPAWWRSRYGDEFDALLAARPMTPFDVLDVALSALDTRLRPRRTALPNTSGTNGAGAPTSLRAGGFAGLAGGVMWAGGLIAASSFELLQPVGVVLHVLGAVELLLALVILGSFLARAHPVASWLAVLLPAIGLLMSLAGITASSVLGDRAVVGEMSGWWIWSVGLLTSTAGLLIFGLATARDARLSRHGARLLAGSAGLILLAMPAGMGLVDLPILQIALLVGMSGIALSWWWIGASAVRIATTPSPARTDA